MAKFTEKQLISKLQELKQIKPNNDWVLLTKKQIFKEDSQKAFSFISFIKEIQRGERFVLRHKPAFAVLTVLIVFIGVFGFAQNSVPGDSLFTLKKMTEQGQSVFVTEKNEAKYDLALVNKRLDDLTKIAEENEVNNLASAINEYQESISKVVESLAKTEDLNLVSEGIKELQAKEEKIKSYGIEIGDSEKINNVLADIVAREIKKLENIEEEVLAEITESFEAGDYSQALEKILLLNN